jgi:hypothetical protein
MMGTLPLMSSQLRFSLLAERTGRRMAVPLLFRTPPARLSTAGLERVLQSIVAQNPALSSRIQFARGTAYQEWHPTGYQYLELYAKDSGTAWEMVAEAIDEFETSPYGASVAARLVRSPKGDDLLLIFDHAQVDEQSLLLIKQQLSSPVSAASGHWARYEAAVQDRVAFEAAAAAGSGVEFWNKRLAATAGEFPAETETFRPLPFVTFPSVAIPAGFRGSLFPYVLFAMHRALRDVGELGPTVIGYAWGNRNAAYADIVGCFMNTIISLGVTGGQQGHGTVADFLREWYREIDHADVPFTSVVSSGSAFSGWVTAFLAYEHVRDRTVDIAGIRAVEVSLGSGYAGPGSAVGAAVMVRESELHLRLITDEEIAGYRADDLGPRWCHWVGEALALSVSTEAARR